MPSDKMFANEIKNKEAKKLKTILVYTVKQKLQQTLQNANAINLLYILVNITVICCTRDCF